MCTVHTSIFCPNTDGLKLDFRTTLTSILDRPTSRTNGMTLNGKLMSLVVRYLTRARKGMSEQYIQENARLMVGSVMF